MNSKVLRLMSASEIRFQRTSDFEVSSRFMKLRFRSSGGTAKNLSDLIVFVTLNIVENKHLTITVRQFADRTRQSNSVSEFVSLCFLFSE